MSRLNMIDWIAIILLVVGGLNWGLVGLFDLDLVAAVLGKMSILSRIVYILVGAAAVYVAAVSMRLARK